MSIELQAGRRASIAVAILFAMLVYKGLGFVGFYPRLEVELLAAVNAGSEVAAAQDKTARLYLNRRDVTVHVEPTVEAGARATAQPQRISMELPGGPDYGSLLLELMPDGGEIRITEMRVESFGARLRLDAAELAAMLEGSAMLEGGALVIESVKGQRAPYLWLSVDEFYSKAQRRWSGLCRAAWALILGVMVYFSFRQAEIVLSMVRGHSVHDVALAMVFVALISLPILNSYFPMDRNIRSTEKRVLAPRPDFRFEHIVEFPKAYDSYYADNFGFRNLLVNWNNVLHARHLGVAAVEGKVVMGKDGWLYLEGLPIDDYKCTIPFSEEELEKAAKSLIQRRDYFRAMGVPFYFIVAPNKASIYPEYLPDSVKRIGEGCRFDQLIEYMRERTDLRVIDVRKELTEAKQSERVYHKTDTHWNEYGAFIAYERLMREIVKDVPDVKLLRFEDMVISHGEGDCEAERRGATSVGDLAGMLGLQGSMLEMKVHVNPSAGFRAVRIEESGYKNPNANPSVPIRLFERKNSGNKRPSLLVLRDSFSEYLIPYISESFGRSLYLWVYHLTPEIIEREKPDVAVMEMVERHLMFLTYDAYDGSYFGDPSAEGLAGGGGQPAADAAAGDGK